MAVQLEIRDGQPYWYLSPDIWAVPGSDPNGAPETQWATVTCLTPASGSAPCTEWKLTPSGTHTAPGGSLEYRNVARLIKYVTTRNTTTNANQGDFYFSFAIRLTNP